MINNNGQICLYPVLLTARQTSSAIVVLQHEVKRLRAIGHDSKYVQAMEETVQILKAATGVEHFEVTKEK